MKNPLRDVQNELASQGEAIRALQAEVARLSEVLARVDATAGQAALDAAGMPDVLRTAVDDLGDRIGRLTEQVDGIVRVGDAMAELALRPTAD